jgi:hypothetical protein
MTIKKRLSAIEKKRGAAENTLILFRTTILKLPARKLFAAHRLVSR